MVYPKKIALMHALLERAWVRTCPQNASPYRVVECLNIKLILFKVAQTHIVRGNFLHPTHRTTLPTVAAYLQTMGSSCISSPLLNAEDPEESTTAMFAAPPTVMSLKGAHFVALTR